MADLYYAVIALKESELDQVVGDIKNELPTICEWLLKEIAKDKPSYGIRSEDWTPFNGKSIEGLIADGESGYQSKTNLIDELKFDDVEGEFEDLGPMDSIQIFFIDPLALFLKKYAKLADELDFFVAKQRECCVVISRGLTNEQQEQLIRSYCKRLRTVCSEYRSGRPHRIVLREDDLRNFRNSRLKYYGSNRPSQAANQDERLKSDTTRPPSL